MDVEFYCHYNFWGGAWWGQIWRVDVVCKFGKYGKSGCVGTVCVEGQFLVLEGEIVCVCVGM